MNHEAPTIPPNAMNEAATLPPKSSDTEPATKSASTSLPHIPGFHLESELGRGGMGVVYLARQEKLNRLVALKMIISGDHANEETKLRFLAEAEAIAKLHHPGIVQVHEFGTHDNNPYFALEYISGGSLDKKLAGNPLPPREAADLVEKLARAVQSAHDAGIIHRDLKPANILLDSPLPPAGEGSGVRGSSSFAPKITDFGLVKKVGSDMTATGQILGTPSYMAPEQADGKKSVGPAADIYALGAILYECLTGRAPFKAATPLDTLLQVLNDEPLSVRQLQAKTPMDLETICHKCLQKEPGKRYTTAAELAEDLGRYLRNEPIIARRIGRVERTWRWCKRYPAVAGLLVFLVFGAVAAFITSAYVSKINGDLINSNQSLDAALEETKKKETLAIQRARETRREVERFQVANGFRNIEAGDYYGGMLWFAQPLIGEVRSENENSHQHRLTFHWRWKQSPSLVQHFAVQQNVANYSFSPDGQFILAVSDRMTIKKWSTLTGNQISFPTIHKRKVNHIEISIDSSRVVTASDDNTSQILDTATGHPLTIPLKHPAEVMHASFSYDTKRVVTVSKDGIVRVWNAIDGQLLTRTINLQNTWGYAFFSPNGKYIATRSERCARVWDSFSGKPITSRLEHTDSVSFVNFSPNSLRIVTASDDYIARVWDVESGLPISPPLSHQYMVRHVSFSPDGHRVLTASLDKTARVWDAATGQPVTPSLSHNNYTWIANFSPDGRWVVTASEDQTARVWDATSGKPLTPGMTNHSGVKYAQFTPDCRHVITMSRDNIVRVWDLATCFPIKPFLQLQELPGMRQEQGNSASFSSDGRHVLTSTRDGKARVWNTITGQPDVPYMFHPNGVLHSAFNPDGSQLVTTGWDNTARLWTSLTGRQAFPPLAHRGGVMFASFSPDGRSIVTASADSTARIWDAKTGKPITSPMPHQGSVQYADFSPDGRSIVTASADGTARIWDTQTGKPIASPIKHQDTVQYVGFSPDGRSIVTASTDSTARVWNASTGIAQSPLLIHNKAVWRACFSSDSRRIVTASSDKTARIWDASTGQPLSPSLEHLDNVIQASFSPDGNRVVTATSDNSARVWDTTLDPRQSSDWSDLFHFIYGFSLDKHGSYQKIPSAQLQSLFNELKAKFAADFSVTSQQIRAWREDQIAQCMKERNLPAALFHQNWLLAEAVQEAAKTKK